MPEASALRASGPADGRKPVRAAQYVRMSTEHQKYSTENQAAAIALYAEARGYEIVRTYADEGKSGLRIKGRDALKQLIGDVRDGRADFASILVYDVSRWGRFQDTDESAHYEFVCKQAGITVHYCAEQFDNDGSITAAVLKNIKRAMAGEYSRELSTKVFAGQCRLVSLGFKQGGRAPLGLRRQLIDERGNPKTILKFGERKSIQTDRVILVPGPPEEIELVRRMFRMFAEEQRSIRHIAAELNECARHLAPGREWTDTIVGKLLRNEAYIGNLVYNRRTARLGGRSTPNPRDMWIRRDGVFAPILDRALFEAAQARRAQLRQRPSRDELLTGLRSLWQKTGKLTRASINRSPDVPHAWAYDAEFGSLLSAYKLIGYPVDRDYSYPAVNQQVRTIFPGIVADVVTRLTRGGARVTGNFKNGELRINGEFTASILVLPALIARSRTRRWPVWRIDLNRGPRSGLLIVVRLNRPSLQVRDFYVLPRIEFAGICVQLRENNGIDRDTYRHRSLSRIAGLMERRPVADVVWARKMRQAPDGDRPAVLPMLRQSRPPRAVRLHRGKTRPEKSAALIARVYNQEGDNQRRRLEKMKLVNSRFSFIVAAFDRLLSDEHFVALLRGEGLLDMPAPLADRLLREA